MNEARADLWSRLLAAGLVAGEMPAPGEARVPWFVRVMLGVAGWIGAFFLLGFVGALLAFLIRDAGSSVLVGAGACAGAVMIFRAAPKSDFFAQFGLAASLAGQTLLIYGFAQWMPRSVNGIALVIALVEGLLLFLVPNFLHRVLSAWVLSIALLWLLVDAGFYAFAPAAITAAVVAVWLHEFDAGRHGALLRAAGYGLAFAALQTVVMHGALWGLWMASLGRVQAAQGTALQWIGHALSAAVLLWAVFQLLRREGLPLDSGQGRVALAGAVILGIASLKAPGVGPTVAILVVGFANGNRVLAGLGIAALLGYLSHFYYSLSATLLVKSGVLVATGLALLAARVAMRHWWPEAPQKEASHA
jgi:hypothetical protein